jgi:hypothetical protein
MSEKGMLTLEQLENGTSTDRVIMLKSLYKTKHRVQPAYNTTKNWYEGVERLSDDDKKKLDYWVEPHTTLKLEDGYVFDLNQEIDRINWKWVKELKEVAMDFEDFQSSPKAMFYVHIEGREAMKSNASKTNIFEAMKCVMEDSPVNYANRALLLGFDMEGENPEVIKEFLLEQAANKDTNTRVLQVYKSKSLAVQLLFLKAEKKNIIVKTPEGAYKFGLQILGMTSEGSVAFLQEASNKDVLSLLEREVNPSYYKDKASDKEEKSKEFNFNKKKKEDK